MNRCETSKTLNFCGSLILDILPQLLNAKLLVALQGQWGLGRLCEFLRNCLICTGLSNRSVCPWSKSCHLQSTEVFLPISNILWYVPEPEKRRIPEEDAAIGQSVVWLKVMLLCLPEKFDSGQGSSSFSLL